MDRELRPFEEEYRTECFWASVILLVITLSLAVFCIFSFISGSEIEYDPENDVLPGMGLFAALAASLSIIFFGFIGALIVGLLSFVGYLLAKYSAKNLPTQRMTNWAMTVAYINSVILVASVACGVMVFLI